MFFSRVAKATSLLAGKLFPDGRHNTCRHDPSVVPSNTSPNIPDTLQDTV